MDPSSFSADCGTTSSGDCTTASGGDHGTTSGDCGADSGKDRSTERDFTYTDFAVEHQPTAAGPSSPSGPTTQQDTRSPEEIQAQEQRAEARAQKKKERKEKARKVFNGVKVVAENIVKGKF
ncbi:hypothetical protein G6011_08212 [Alternaria panax]|uniref:Uncharacterized protein n=1 Tax=Alternaria panax TaxID=48097 RepID=A0AAD4I9X4_9PLEO|nr:hypothetical protein G6011_08212 [Alternaria panax]